MIEGVNKCSIVFKYVYICLFNFICSFYLIDYIYLCFYVIVFCKFINVNW